MAKKADLLELAKQNDIEVDESSTVAEIEKALKDAGVESKQTGPKSREDVVKELYGKGKNHYQIAEEVYEFVNEDTLKRVAEIVNPTAASDAERYKEL